MTRKSRILLILVYLAFLAFIFEGSARLVFRIPRFSYRLFLDEDYSWRRDWIQRHPAGTGIYYAFDNYDPSKGWVLKPNLRNVQVFGDRILNTNAQGFRGKRDFSYHKESGRQRILVFGDSFTFGDEVSDDETYSHYLQEMLPGSDVINMGIHGYGHDQMLILLREQGIRYEPDIVIIGFLSVDMPRNLLSFRDFAKPRFVLRDGRLELTNVPVPTPEQVMRWDWTRPRVLDVFSILRFKLRNLSGRYQRDMEEITTAIVTNMIEAIRGAHAVPVLAYLPQGEEITSPAAVNDSEKYMFSLCQLNPSAECVSTRPRFAEKVANGEKFKLVGHWGPNGHRTVAEAIKDHLVAKGHVTVRGG